MGFAITIVAGLDERWGWSKTVTIGWHIAGILLFVVWWMFFLWAMASNPFFSESVRIQENHKADLIASFVILVISETYLAVSPNPCCLVRGGLSFPRF